MSAPAVVDFIAKLVAMKKAIDDGITAFEAKVPDVAKPLVNPELEALKLAIDTALAPLDIPAVELSLTQALAVISAGRGTSGGGADATLS